MTDLDYEALAKACYGGHKGSDKTWNTAWSKAIWTDAARAVIAALRDQGMVVVRRDDLGEAISQINGDGDMPWVVLDRLEDALAAPEPAREDATDG